MNSDLYLVLKTGHVTTSEDFRRRFSHALCDVTFQGDTALHIAAREGHLNLVTWILQEKPLLAGAINKDNNTPLHEAAKSGNRDLVQLFLREQSYAYHFNKFGETALMIASQYGHVETVRLLLREKSIRYQMEYEPSLREAAYRGYTDVVVTMLDNPIKFSLYNTVRLFIHSKMTLFPALHMFLWKVRETPILHSAVRGGHLETIVAMLNHRSWQNKAMTKKDEYGRCAIHVAAMKGHWDIINEFMSRMLECVEIRCSNHKSVLHYAVEYNQLEVVRNLLSNEDAETVAKLVSREHDRFRNTSLHLAAINGVNHQIVEYLVSFPNVDVNALNEDDMTALDIASAAAHYNPNCAMIVQKLESVGAIQSSPIHKSNTKSHPNNDSKQGEDTNTVNTHMVVASLIATVTFAAIFQIPGGIENEKESIHYGAAKMAFSKLFKLFLFSDIAAFTTSLAVVVAWLVRQQMPDTHFGGPEILSHLSVISLPVSIFWTIVAFGSAAIIVTIPPNFKNMKRKDNTAFTKYTSLLRLEIFLTIIQPLFLGVELLMAISPTFHQRMKSKMVLLNRYALSLQLGGAAIVIFSNALL